jgi:hypothetical protein
VIDQLLTTKLYIPPVRSGRVSRPRLLQRLDEGLGQGVRLILVSGPAGFGKTTLLAEWVNLKHLHLQQAQAQVQVSQISNVKIAWLSLDEHDGDLALLELCHRGVADGAGGGGPGGASDAARHAARAMASAASERGGSINACRPRNVMPCSASSIASAAETSLRATANTYIPSRCHCSTAWRTDSQCASCSGAAPLPLPHDEQ